MSFADKATAFKHSVAGSTINKVVCKASSHELAGPKKKHVDTLINLTNNPHTSMPIMADMLAERFHNSSWIVVMKALITTHNLMTLGNEKFIQCMATRVSPFPLDDYIDRSSPLSMDMSGYVRKYGRYLTSVCAGYRTLVLDIYRMPRGERSPFVTMEVGKLLKCNTTVQQQLDFLLEVDLSAGELNNGVVNTAFLMLYKDLTKLYSCYNDVMINLLENFFEMKKAQCREVLEGYRKFLTRQETVMKFLALAEDVGVDKQSHLNLRQVPEDLLPSLESHISEMDAIRKAASQKQPSPQIRAASEKLTQLSKNAAAANSTSEKASPATVGNGFANSFSSSIPSASEEVLALQKKRFEELKRRASEKNVAVDGADSAATATSAPTSTSKPPAASSSTLDDEFDKIVEQRHTPVMTAKSASNVPKSSSSGAGDLFGLDTWSAPPTINTSASASTNPWGAPAASAPTSNPFQSSYQEVNMFGGNKPAGGAPSSGSSDLLGGDILLPQSISPLASAPATTQSANKPLTGDVNSSLANLSLDLGSSTKTGTTVRTTHQWGEVKTTTLTGGPAYQRQTQLQPMTLPAAGPTFPVNPTVPMYGAQPMGPAPGQFGMGMGMQPQMMGGGMGWQGQQQPMMYQGTQNPFGMPTQKQSLF